MCTIHSKNGLSCPLTVILPKRRKRWRHRGRRGGRRLKNIPIETSFRPIHPHLSALSNNNLTGVIPNDTQNNNPNKYLNARLWNAQSLRNKTITVTDYLIQENVDILFIRDACLNINDSVVIGECTPSSYDFLNFPRGTSDHGGIAVIHKQSMNVQTVNLDYAITTFEYAIVLDPINDIQNIAVYRPMSNISFISKIIEKVASNQLKEYLSQNNLIEMYQSAYVSKRSTETALLKVISCMLWTGKR